MKLIGQIIFWLALMPAHLIFGVLMLIISTVIGCNSYLFKGKWDDDDLLKGFVGVMWPWGPWTCWGHKARR